MSWVKEALEVTKKGNTSDNFSGQLVKLRPFATIALLLSAVSLIAQAEIKFDSTEFDLGQIPQTPTLKKMLWFTNIGTEPLVIRGVRTGDGGSFVDHPKKPIQPKENSFMTFVYDASRVGYFERCISINSNSVKDYEGCKVKVKGKVVKKGVPIQVNQTEIETGNIEFGTIDTVTVEVTNTWAEDLELSLFRIFDYQEADLFYYQVLSKGGQEKTVKNDDNYEDAFYKPKGTVQIKILLRNVYGNSGPFERKIKFAYNSNDTILLTIKGSYVGGPTSNIIYETNHVNYYENHKLVKRITYSEKGNILREDVFENSYCIYSKRYHLQRQELTAEYFYKNGILVRTKNYKVNDY